MSVSAEHVQDRFNTSAGLDPIFRTNDGSNCDHNIDTSTVAGRSAAYSLLRTRGLIRIALPVPAGGAMSNVSVVHVRSRAPAFAALRKVTSADWPMCTLAACIGSMMRITMGMRCDTLIHVESAVFLCTAENVDAVAGTIASTSPRTT